MTPEERRREGRLVRSIGVHIHRFVYPERWSRLSAEQQMNCFEIAYEALKIVRKQGYTLTEIKKAFPGPSSPAP